ncbi:MAG: universal stress protein [Acetobacterales bacterium]
MTEPAGQNDTSPPRSSADAERVFLVVVDDTEEMHAALMFACQRARRTSGRVALLRVIEPVEFQHWGSVARLMRSEAREEAEQLLHRLSEDVHTWSGKVPVLHVREGMAQEEILALIDEDRSICILVLGADIGPGGPGPLVSQFTSKLVARLHVPMTIVPGNMTDEQIRQMA